MDVETVESKKLKSNEHVASDPAPTSISTLETLVNTNSTIRDFHIVATGLRLGRSANADFVEEPMPLLVSRKMVLNPRPLADVATSFDPIPPPRTIRLISLARVLESVVVKPEDVDMGDDAIGREQGRQQKIADESGTQTTSSKKRHND